MDLAAMDSVDQRPAKLRATGRQLVERLLNLVRRERVVLAQGEKARGAAESAACASWPSEGCPGSPPVQDAGKQAPPSQSPPGSSSARRRAPQPSCSTRARPAATSSADAFVRSRSTCQRMAGSPSSSQSITLTTAGYPVADGRSDRRMRCANRLASRDRHARDRRRAGRRRLRGGPDQHASDNSTPASRKPGRKSGRRKVRLDGTMAAWH
jgi:hypothetical protein